MIAAPGAGLPCIVYCCVDDHVADDDPDAAPDLGARYTRGLLKQTLYAMGCKLRHADKACDKLFLLLQQRAALAPAEPLSLAARLRELRPGAAAVSLARPQFELLVSHCLAAHDPGAPLSDLRIACALQERRASVAVLLCGTSGTGKSTLASLLAARLGITTVVSTDSIRQMMCGFASPDEQALLRLSTYTAGGAAAAAAAAAGSGGGDRAPASPGGGLPAGSARAARQAAVQGYLAQCEAVAAPLERLVAAAEAARRSVVLEGVHLGPALAARLMGRCPTVVPFLVHISNEAKHLERFAVRAKTMTLRPERNRYVRHLRSIRAIQDELVAAAGRRGVPRVDNTNVDRSVASIHATVLGCLRRRAGGEALFDPGTGRCGAVAEEYARCTAATWSGRSMLELIRSKAAAGAAGGSPEGPSTSAASTPQGPLSEAGEAAAAAGQGSFYGSDSQASSQGDGGLGGGGPGGGGGGPGGGGAGREGDGRESALGSVLETDEAQSEDAGG